MCIIIRVIYSFHYSLYIQIYIIIQILDNIISLYKYMTIIMNVIYSF